MAFKETFQQVAEVLNSIGSTVEENDYDGLIVKKLEASNTLDKGRTTKQSHIAITGPQMDMFPYVRADGYFEVDYDDEDQELKKYFVAQIPVYLHKENVEYLDDEIELFTEKEKLVHISIVRSRRKDAADQIQMSMTYMDTPTYVDYRRIVHAGSYMILLKRKSQLLYDMYCVKPENIEVNDASLVKVNNCFEKLSTNTVVHLDELLKIEQTQDDPEERNKRLFRYWLSMQVKPEDDSDAGNPYAEDSINRYVRENSRTYLTSVPDKSVFYTTDIGEVQLTCDAITDDPTRRSAVLKYIEYLGTVVSEEDCEGVFNHRLFGMHIKQQNTALSIENPHICIGWSAMGDLSDVSSKEQLANLYDEYFDKNPRGKGQDVGQVWRFLNDMQIGDYVIFAEHSVFHIGRVESDYYYDEKEYTDQSADYKNNRKVRWLKKNISRSVLSSDLHKSLMTAMSIFTLNDYRSAVADLLRGTYVKDEERNEVEEEIMELVFNTSVETPYETNRIVFGAPGTGKSFLLKEDVKKVTNLYSGTVVERVTFHPEYSYSQFVGTYKPTMIEPSPVIELDGDKKEVMSVLQDKTLSAQEKYDLLYDKFKDEGLTRLPILIGMYCNDSFKTRKQDGTDAVGDNSVERNHGRAIRQYVNLDANVSKKSEIAYEYVPGPFMRMYVAAMKSARTTMPQPHILIIEEINRAKVAAVFGDVFQLLDRDEEGVSEYDIQASEDIKKYLAKELGGSPETYNRIRIPNNMFIWATMNSADQGVFPMDTAFKRRWNFEYLGIDKNDEKIKGVGKIVLAGSDEPIEWNKLRKAINAKMSSTEFKINEDKLMGPFFLSKKAIASDENGMIIDTDRFIDMFKSKVIMYLYEDAVKQGKHRFFDGCPDTGKYSAVCDEFDKNGIAIFGPTFKEIFYDKED